MRLLDLFCGAGGAAMGYHQAGFDEIVGIDVNPQPRYPFTFIQGDALKPPVRLDEFDLIHASPPCQHFTSFAKLNGNQGDHPDLLDETREMLKGHPFVIENVMTAGLDGVKLCGSMFGLRHLRRHRRFEASWLIWQPGCRHKEQGQIIGVYGNGGPQNPGGRGRRYKNIAEAREVMGIDWMSRREIAEAIPPVYTRYIGEAFLAC